MSRCLYVSFFTPDYEAPASRLVQSLREFGLDHEVRRVPDTGRWVANCAYKPAFILEMLATYPGRPIVWTDADSVVRQRPVLFEDSQVGSQDVAVCNYRWRQGSEETLSGTLWFSGSAASLQLAEYWKALQSVAPEEYDQSVLRRALKQVREWGGAKWFALPVEYCFIFDLHRQEHPDARPVFEHFQHSRKVKEVKR